MRQTTDTAEQLFDLVVSTFAQSSENKLADLDELKKKSGVSQEDWEETLAFCAQVKSFFFLCPSVPY